MRTINKEGLQGFTFGMMDGIITALGILMGLSALENRSVVLIGVLVAGLADSFANAATILMSVIISLPVLILPLRTALWISWIIGTFSLVVLGIIVADVRKMER